MSTRIPGHPRFSPPTVVADSYGTSNIDQRGSPWNICLAIRALVATLEQGLARNERAVIDNVLRDAVPEFRGEAA